MATDLPLADEPRPDRCETCRFAHASQQDYVPQHGNPSGQSVRLTRLECRRRAPVCAVASEGDFIPGDTFWPAIVPDHWCGEWQAEAKGA